MTYLQRTALTGLPLLADSLPYRIKAASLNVLGNLTIPRIRPIFLNPLQEVCQFARWQFNNCRLDFLNAHIQIIP